MNRSTPNWARPRLAVAVSHALACFALPLAAGFASSAHAQGAQQDDAALPAVTVSTAPASLPGDLPAAYAGGQVASGASVGVLGKQKFIDLPFSVTSYTAKLIEDQQARTIADVLQNDPAVRVGFGYGNLAELFVIRGFVLNGDDVSLNGLYGITPRQMILTEGVERVDVFKGTSAFVNGVPPSGSGLGGGVNLQLKRADDKALTRVSVEGSASGEIGTHVDVGRRFGDQGQFGIRVNSAVRGGETSVDGEHNRSRMTSVALDYRGDKLRLYADFIYQRVRINDGRSVVYVSDRVPAAPSATYNYSQTWTFSELEDTLGMLRGEYDFAPGWTVYAAGGVHHGNEHGDYSSPNYSSSGSTAYRLGVPHKTDALSAEAGVRGRFATGPVSHAVNFGYSITHVEGSSAYDMSSTYATSVDNVRQVPRPAAIFAGGDFSDPGVTERDLMRSVAVSDTLGFFSDRVLFTLGARHQNIHVNSYGYTGELSDAYDQSINTPVLGLVLKPLDNLSLYANRIDGLSKGDTAPSGAVNHDQVLAPYRTKQFEAGAKYEAGSYGANLAVYQIKRPTAYLDPASRVYGTNGDQRHRGVELSVFGEPVKGLRLLGGASYIDAKLQGTQGGLTDGNRPVGVPRFLFNANVEWDVPQLQGLTLNARMVHTDKQYVDAANTLSISPWNRFDVGARYSTRLFDHDTVLRATLLNVTNKAYWASSIGGYLTMGAPRTLLLSLTTDF